MGRDLRDQLKQAARLWKEKGRSPTCCGAGRRTGSSSCGGSGIRAGSPREEDFAKAMAERAARQRRRRRALVGAVVAASLAVAGVTGVLWARARAAALRARRASSSPSAGPSWTGTRPRRSPTAARA